MTVGELPFPVRLAFYAALLASLAVADLVSDGLWFSLLVLAGFLFVVLPVVVRAFARERGPMPPKATTRDVIAFAAVLTLLAAIETALVPDFGLGAIFWIVAVVVPSLEVLSYLTRQEARARADSEPDS
jgi:hypothetical protein